MSLCLPFGSMADHPLSSGYWSNIEFQQKYLWISMVYNLDVPVSHRLTAEGRRHHLHVSAAPAPGVRPEALRLHLIVGDQMNGLNVYPN